MLGKESDLASRRALWQANFEVAELTARSASRRTRWRHTGRSSPPARRWRPKPRPTGDQGRRRAQPDGRRPSAGDHRTDRGGGGDVPQGRGPAGRAGPDDRDGAAARAVLADCRSRLGWLLHTTGRNDEALSVYRLARADQEALAAAPGATAESRRDLADTINRVANLLAATGKSSEAEAEYRKALAIRQKLADDNPAVTDFRDSLADSHNNLGDPAVADGQAIGSGGRVPQGAGDPAEAGRRQPRRHRLPQQPGDEPRNLGILLSDTGKSSEAEAEYRKALAIQQKLADDNPAVTDSAAPGTQPQRTSACCSRIRASRAEAEAEYRKALAIRQKLADDNPAVTQIPQPPGGQPRQPRPAACIRRASQSEAEAEYRKALAIRQKLADDNPAVTDFRTPWRKPQQPRHRAVHRRARHRKRRPSTARRWRSIRSWPTTTPPSPNSAASWRRPQQPRHAAARKRASYRKRRPSTARHWRFLEKLADDNPAVTQFQRLLAASHSEIGSLKRDAGHPEQALASYGRALAVQERLAREHPAVAEYQSELAKTHHTIGLTQTKTDHPDEALTSYGRALAIRERLAEHPGLPDLASGVGATLNNMATIELGRRHFGEARTRLEAAIDCQKRALAANPNNPQYRQLLANHLTNIIAAAAGLKDGKGASEARRELEELKASDPRFAALDERLAAVLKGEVPENNPERLALAQRTYNTGRFSAAARLWAEAFESDRNLAANRQVQHRYNAACAAALAGCGKTQDNPAPDEAVRAELPRQARAWLDAELPVWTRLLVSAKPKERTAIAKTLEHWQVDTDLAGVREPEAIDALPEPERAGWREFWKKVAEAFARAKG